MRQATVFCLAAALVLAPNRQALAAELEQAQLTVLCGTRSDTHCDESFPGTTKWSTERLPVGADQKSRVAVRGDVEIPSHGVTMKWLMYPNSDKDLPATHIIEIHLALPADLQPTRPVASVFMANSPLTTGDGFYSTNTRVGDWSFMVAIEPNNTERNLKLIQQYCWFDIRTVAPPPFQKEPVISMEKGKTGARAFAEAFAAWGADYAERSCVQSFAPPTERQAPDDRVVAEARARFVDGVFGKR